MFRSARRAAAAAAVAGTLAALAVAAPAAAAPTAASPLDCGSRSVVVDGFGRMLHVVDSTASVVTRAVREGGTVVFDSPAAADRPLVTCTTVPPGGRASP